MEEKTPDKDDENPERPKNQLNSSQDNEVREIFDGK